MATVTGITAQKADEILDGTVASVSIVGTSLIFTRHDGTQFNAGNFEVYIEGQLLPHIENIDTQVQAEVASKVAVAVPGAVAGSSTDLGNISGAISFGSINGSQLVNRTFRATLTGNVSLNAAALTGCPPGTQFIMVLKQDLTGNRLLTLTGFKKAQGVLTLSGGGNSTDIISFFYDGVSWYAGAMGLGFA